MQGRIGPRGVKGKEDFDSEGNTYRSAIDGKRSRAKEALCDENDPK